MTSYGLWLLVVLNSAIFIVFAFSFTRPSNARDWRLFGAFRRSWRGAPCSWATASS